MQGLSEYQGQLIFVLEPGEKVSSDEENDKLYLRPNFAFDPTVLVAFFVQIRNSIKKNDSLLPCSEAGLPFTPGAILEVIQRKEEWWWQARQIATQSRQDESAKANQAGLVPSIALGELNF